MLLAGLNRTDSVSMAGPIIRSRMPELDTIRGIAVLAVFVFHGFDGIAWLPVVRPAWQRAILGLTLQGWAGVNLFFVLSGFLITGILLDSLPKPGYYSRFYSRRALRILPAYYLVLLVLFCMGRAGLIVGNGLGEFLALSFVYLSNVVTLFGVNTFYWPLWSLAVEEHFYLLWPAAVRLLRKRGLAITAVLICLIEPMLRLYALHTGSDLWWAGPHRGGSYRYTWMYADGLALGALLALFARSAWGTRSNLLKLAGMAAAGTAGMAVLCAFVPQALNSCLRGTLVNYGALAIIATFLWLGSGVHSRWVNIRALAFYGYISYGLYLIHYLSLATYDFGSRMFAPALSVGPDFGRACLRFAVALAVATAIAYLSRVTFEEFFLRMKDKSAKLRTGIRSAAVA